MGPGLRGGAVEGELEDGLKPRVSRNIISHEMAPVTHVFSTDNGIGTGAGGNSVIGSIMNYISPPGSSVGRHSPRTYVISSFRSDAGITASPVFCKQAACHLTRLPSCPAVICHLALSTRCSAGGGPAVDRH